jgi:hypothetical protein
MFGPLFMYYYLANPTSVGTVPAMPRGLNATATTTTVTVKWSPVSTANGYVAIIGISSFFGVVPLVHQVRGWYSGVAIKMGRRQGATREHI